jgi:hypothetical protein
MLNELRMAIDFGGSSTKVLASYGEEKLAFAMRSEVVEVPKGMLSQRDKVQGSNPLHCCHVSLGTKYYAVGTLALKFGGFTKLKTLKVDSAPIKVLAAVGIALDRFQLNDNCKLKLVYCLPPSEIEQSQNFDSTLKKALSRFDTASGLKQVDLVSSNCFPEGFGIFTKHSRERPETVQEHCVSTLMMGFRNLSILSATGGNIELAKSSNLGFITVVRDVLETIDGYSDLELSNAIARYQIDGDERVLEEILVSTGTKERARELAQLKKAINLSLKRYLSLIQSWLQEYLPTQTKEIIVCGGTSDCLNPELAEWLRTKVPPLASGKGYGVFFHGGFNPPESIAALGYGNRFADVYYLFEYYL